MNYFDILLAKKLEDDRDPKVEGLSVTENGRYHEDGVVYDPVIVNVPETPLSKLTVTQNGTYTAPTGTGYNEVDVDVPLPENAYLLKEIEDVEIATFSDGSDLSMPKLEVAIEPVQDLHGYDAPWVGGAGKNKCPVNSGSITVGDFVVFETPLPSGTYSFSFYASRTPSSNSYASFVIYDKDGAAYSSAIGVDAASLNGTTLIKREDVSFDNGISKIYAYSIAGNWSDSRNYTLNISNLQIEEGSTATTFAPYSNICPIIGWDEVNVSVTGKNLVNWKWNTFNDGKMEIFLKGGTYTLSAESTLANGNAYIRGTKPSGEYVSREELGLTDWGASLTNGVYYGGGGQQTYTFNVPNGGAKIEFGKLNNNGTINAQIEIGDTATTYEPYNGQTITIDLDGTRYGGKVDLVSGVLTVTHGYIASYNGETLPSTWISDRDVYAEGTTPTIGAEVCYELATPTTIQLTPTVVKSLRGMNNVWADCGNIIDLSYLAKEE